jgi:hypothetical protein
MREPDDPPMGRYYWGLQEPLEEKDDVDGCGLEKRTKGCILGCVIFYGWMLRPGIEVEGASYMMGMPSWWNRMLVLLEGV